MPVESWRRSYSVPGFRLPLRVGSHCSPGYLWDAAWIKQRVVQPERRSPLVSPCPFWTKPITHVGLSHMTTIQTCVRVPTHTQLCSTGFAGGFSVTAFRSRFTVLRISRDRGDRASPLHLGERNCTSTGPKLSKTSSVHVPHPWRVRHFEGTDRGFPLHPALPDSLDGRY